MSATNTKRVMGQIDRALTDAVGRHQRRHGGELPHGACVHEPVENRTPFDELADKEDGAETLPLFDRVFENGGGNPFGELDEQDARARRETEEATRIWLEANAWLMEFLFAEGPHPGKVMRRLYAWVKKFRPSAIWDMGYRNMGLLFDESGAAIEWRVGAILDEYAKAKGLEAVKMPWQRSEEACESYSDVQQGNGNRVGGKRSGKHKISKQK